MRPDFEKNSSANLRQLFEQTSCQLPGRFHAQRPSHSNRTALGRFFTKAHSLFHDIKQISLASTASAREIKGRLRRAGAVVFAAKNAFEGLRLVREISSRRSNLGPQYAWRGRPASLSYFHRCGCPPETRGAAPHGAFMQQSGAAIFLLGSRSIGNLRSRLVAALPVPTTDCRGCAASIGYLRPVGDPVICLRPALSSTRYDLERTNLFKRAVGKASGLPVGVQAADLGNFRLKSLKRSALCYGPMRFLRRK